MKFQLHRISIKKFHLKLSDTAVTLKYGKGHQKWYEHVNLNEYYHHAKFGTYHVNSV